MLIDAPLARIEPGSNASDDRLCRLPPAVLKPANRLLEQQFWLWGCDIRRPEGNILSQLGFEKVKAPAETGLNTSQYRCPLSITCTIALWGFGVCVSDSSHGSVFVPRAGLRPRYCQSTLDTTSAWEPAWFERILLGETNRDLVPCYHLVGQLIDWIAWYECRVLEIAGQAHRQRSIETWKRPVVDHAPLAQQWLQLGLAIRDTHSNWALAVGPDAH